MPEAPARYLISGSSGTIGRALLNRLDGPGHPVARLVRSPGPVAPNHASIAWKPASGTIDEAALRRFAPTTLINLAGESVFGWWSAAKRRAIIESRLLSTRLLVDQCARLTPPPCTLLSASAVGYYGDTGDCVASESAPPGAGFLADLCVKWEKEARRAAELGLRVVLLRIGVVISPTGGALAAARPLFRLGLGGPIAGGGMWIPWISLTDTLRAIEHLCVRSDITGPVNLVGPAAVTQRHWSKALGKALHRPAMIPCPRWLLTASLGDTARETILSSCRAAPEVLRHSGFTFMHPTIESALDAALAPSFERPMAK